APWGCVRRHDITWGRISRASVEAVAVAEIVRDGLGVLVLHLLDVRQKGDTMLHYALVFLVVALIAGFLGFGSVAFASAAIAKVCFFVFLVLFVVSLIS